MAVAILSQIQLRRLKHDANRQPGGTGPLADKVGMHPIHFAVIGVISLAFGLVTPPYGLCLLISCSLGEVQVVNVLKDVGIILVPMLILLIIIIVFPEFVLFLPRLITPKFL